MTVPEFLTYPHKAAPDQNDAVWIIPFLGDGPFQFSLATGLRLGQPFVFPRPIVVSISAKLRACYHLLQGLIRQAAENWQLAEGHAKSSLAVNGIHLVPQGLIRAHD